jgi:hypothetical protein
VAQGRQSFVLGWGRDRRCLNNAGEAEECTNGKSEVACGEHDEDGYNGFEDEVVYG